MYALAHLNLLLLLVIAAFLVVQTVKSLAAMPETWVQSLGREDPLEKGIANQSSILAWRIPSTEKPGGLQSTGSQRIRHNWATDTFDTFTSLSLCYDPNWVKKQLRMLTE